MSQEDDRLSDAEIAKRRDEALLRALNTPHKLHSEMKLGTHKAKAGAKANPPKTCGRPKKKSATEKR